MLLLLYLNTHIVIFAVVGAVDVLFVRSQLRHVLRPAFVRSHFHDTHVVLSTQSPLRYEPFEGGDSVSILAAGSFFVTTACEYGYREQSYSYYHTTVCL